MGKATNFSVFDWLSNNTWVFELLLLGLLLLFVNIVLKRWLASSKRKSQIKGSDWRAYIDQSTIRPIHVLLWVLVIFFSIAVAARYLKISDKIFYVNNLRNIGIVVCVAWFLLRWKNVFQKAMVSRRVRGKPSFDPVSLEIVNKVFTIVILFISLLTLMQVVGLNVAPLVTFGGIGAAALGIASKDVVANFFGGMMLYITRPFVINDFVELPSKNLTGTIEEIGWYLTCIRNLERKPIYIPNAVFSGDLVINYSRMTHRCIDDVIRLRFEDVELIEGILEQIRQLFRAHAEIDHNMPIYAFVRTIGTYAIELDIKAYTLSTRYDEYMLIKGKILLEIYNLIEKTGAQVQAFPGAVLDVRP